MESSYHSIHARRPSMEVFQGVEFVALRVWCCNSYLHADENGRSVYHGNLRGGSGGGSLHNAVWAVEEVVAGVPPTRYVLLRGSYGRYLGSPDAPDSEREGCCSLEAAQRDRDVLEVGAIMWRAVGCSGPDLARGCVVLLHDKSGHYLRGNQTFLARRPGVSVHSDVDNETSLRWEVVRVTPSQVRPELPIATECNLTKNLVAACFPPLRRQIQFVTAGAGAVGNIDVFTGKSVQLLREKLAGILGYDEFTLCVRAGIHGRLTPLLIDLPRSRETLHIVLVRPNSEADDQLLFPNLNALLLLASVTSHISGSSSSDRGYAVSGSNGLRLPLITLRPNETAPQSSTPHNAYTLPLTDNGTAATAKADDEIWNKRQIGYVYILSTSLAVLFLARPFLPAGYDGWMLAAFASVWGLGNVCLPCGMFGERICKSLSRHVGHILYMTFSALVIYGIYLLAVHADPTHPASVPALALPSLGLTWEECSVLLVF